MSMNVFLAGLITIIFGNIFAGILKLLNFHGYFAGYVVGVFYTLLYFYLMLIR